MKILTKKLYAILSGLVLASTTLVPTVMAAPSVDDLVNTESYFEIAEDGTTDIELQFGLSTGVNQWLLYDPINAMFEMSNDLGLDGDTLYLDLDDDETDTAIQFGNAAQTITYDETTNNEFVISDDVSVQGDIAQDGTNFAIDADNAGVGANVTITANQGSDSDGVLRYNATTNEWEISNDGGTYYSVVDANDLATLTGTDYDSWTIDEDDNSGGNVTLQFGNASNYIAFDGTEFDVSASINFGGNTAENMALDQGSGPGSYPVAPSDGQVFYRTDTNTMYIYDLGTTTWVAQASSGGNGNIALSPHYPDVTYYDGAGPSHTGKLTYYYDNTNDENAYRWETTKPTSQTYNIVVRLQLPDNFNGWKTTPIEFLYRTDTVTVGDNDMDLTMIDTAGTAATLANNTGLVSAVAGVWENPASDITITGGTWTAGDWFTVNVEMASTNAGGTEAGSLEFNFDTTD